VLNISGEGGTINAAIPIFADRLNVFCSLGLQQFSWNQGSGAWAYDDVALPDAHTGERQIVESISPIFTNTLEVFVVLATFVQEQIPVQPPEYGMVSSILLDYYWTPQGVETFNMGELSDPADLILTAAAIFTDTMNVYAVTQKGRLLQVYRVPGGS
jgi:hypothetical protein